MATASATSLTARQPAWPGYVAAVAALGYAAPHFWWGAGISAMLPGDFATAPHGDLEAAIGYWMMGALAVFGAVLSLALVRPWGRRMPACSSRSRRGSPRSAWPSGASRTSRCAVPALRRPRGLGPGLRRPGRSPAGRLGAVLVHPLPDLGHHPGHRRAAAPARAPGGTLRTGSTCRARLPRARTEPDYRFDCPSLDKYGFLRRHS